jgi:hypothetical protein
MRVKYYYQNKLIGVVKSEDECLEEEFERVKEWEYHPNDHHEFDEDVCPHCGSRVGRRSMDLHFLCCGKLQQL